MPRIFRYFPKRRGPVVPLRSAAPYVSYWAQPTNQPMRGRVPKRQQPIPNEGGWLKTANAFTTNSSTINGRIRVSVNPALGTGIVTPENWPHRHRWVKRQQPPERTYVVPPVTNSSTINGRIRVSVNPANGSGLVAAAIYPQRHRWLKRQQLPKRPYVLPPTTNSSTINGRIRVSVNPANIAGFTNLLNQPLRSRVPKRQQPLERQFIFTQPVTVGSSSINGRIRVSANPSFDMTWKQPPNQPRPVKYKRVEIPGGAIFGFTEAPYITYWKQPPNQPLKARVLRRQQPLRRPFVLVQTITVNSSTIGGQIRVSVNPAASPSWKQLVNQPLRNRVPKRQQPFAYNKRFGVPGANTATINGQIRVSVNPANSPAWIHQTNQPLKSRVPRRQQPFAYVKRFQLIANSFANIGGQIRVSANPSLQAFWQRPTNEPLRSRIPKRQQPFAYNKRFAVTVSFTSTINGQIRISANPSLIPSWKQQVNQPLKNRVPKRQQPFAINKRFAVTTGTTSTIPGRIRVSANPATTSFWRQPTNQLLRKRVPKRLMVNRVYPARPLSNVLFDRVINVTLKFRKPVTVNLAIGKTRVVKLARRKPVAVNLSKRHTVPVNIVIRAAVPITVKLRSPISVKVKGPNVS